MEGWTTELQQRLEDAWDSRVPIDRPKDRVPSMRPCTAADLADLDDPGLRSCFGKTREENQRVRPAEVAQRIEGRPGVEFLIAALGALDPNTRWHAAAMLAEADDPRATESLIAALQDTSKRVAQMAARALGRLGDARAVEPLVAVLGDEAEWLRESAAEALLEIGELAVPSLVVASRGGNRLVRKQARQLLRENGVPMAPAASSKCQLPMGLNADKLLRLGRALSQRLQLGATAGHEVPSANPVLDDGYQQDDIARGLRATLVAVLTSAFSSGSASYSFLQGVFSLAQSQAALYGIPWVDVIASLRDLPELPFVDRLQHSTHADRGHGATASYVVEDQCTPRHVSTEDLAPAR
jgi:HEAT repeat protein